MKPFWKVLLRGFLSMPYTHARLHARMHAHAHTRARTHTQPHTHPLFFTQKEAFPNYCKSKQHEMRPSEWHRGNSDKAYLWSSCDLFLVPKQTSSEGLWDMSKQGCPNSLKWPPKTPLTRVSAPLVNQGQLSKTCFTNF